MDRRVASSLFAFALFVGMLILLNVGRRIGARHLASAPKGARTGTWPKQSFFKQTWRFSEIQEAK